MRLLAGLALVLTLAPARAGEVPAPATPASPTAATAQLTPVPTSPAPQPIRAEELRAGAAIYQKMCAECHGKNGEGVPDKYDEPLSGERTIVSLARLIDKTMPDGEPEKSTTEDSRLVAAYIHDAFYSPAARARNHPPKHELARLTNRQFRESVADLLGSFRPGPPPGTGTGLKGQYFQSDGMNKKQKRGFDREDKALDFDFAEGSPGGGISAEQFSIGWEGSLLAPKTGTYEFRIKTPNGARLYVNADLRDGDNNRRDDSDAKREATLIDAWVSSGDTVREETGRIFLLGGRSYSFRFDYFKYKEKHGSVRLEWKPPGGVWAVVAAPWISPAPANRVAIVDVAFPADDGSLGFERGTTVSKEWHEATTKSALAIAAEVTNRLGYLSGTRQKEGAERDEKLRQFAETFAARAFRRPLTAELREAYINRIFAPEVAPELAVKRVVLAVLKSPRFLYPDLGETDDLAIAARLALNLWDSLPDQALTELALNGELHTEAQVRAQAGRMAQDPRTKAKLMDFFRHWVGADEVEDLTKDAKAFPGFDANIVSDLRQSMDYFIEHVVWSEQSDYRELLLADYLYINPRLAKFYGMTVPVTDTFERLYFEPGQRAGIFTHPLLLSAYSYTKSTSPIHRGVFLTRHIMGRMLKPPPVAVTFEESHFAPTLTMREKITELTRKESCMSCHSTINPLGFSLENFDAIGRFRFAENNKQLDVSSDYQTAEGDHIQLHGARDLAEHTAASEAARQGFIRQLFHYTIKQTPAAFGPETLQDLDAAFVKSDFHIRKLLIELNIRAALPHEASPTASR
jgi:mono/diheme cytochrome c family protein